MKRALQEAARAGQHGFGGAQRRFHSAFPNRSCRAKSTIPTSPLVRSPFLATTWTQKSLQRTSPRSVSTGWRRHNSSDASPLTDRALPRAGSEEPVNREVPSYDLTFTCKPCETRSTHRISKQGYHKGTVLITCPNCKNRHLIADHLKIFGPDMTIDKFLEEQGEVVKRGTLGPDGDIEVWDHNTDDPSTGKHVGAPYKAETDESRDKA